MVHFVFGNALVLFLVGVNFPSRHNTFFGNELVLFLEGKLASTSFPLQCNDFVGNAVLIVLEGNLVGNVVVVMDLHLLLGKIMKMGNTFSCFMTIFV